jgi:hypothetical protein
MPRGALPQESEQDPAGCQPSRVPSLSATNSWANVSSGSSSATLASEGLRCRSTSAATRDRRLALILSSRSARSRRYTNSAALASMSSIASPTATVSLTRIGRRLIRRRRREGGNRCRERSQGSAPQWSVDLLARVPHVHLDYVGPMLVGEVPCGIEELLLAQHPPRSAHEGFEQRELARGQLDLGITRHACRVAGSSRSDPISTTAGRSTGSRRTRARSRASSSASENGLVR